jgi:HAD superfamily hydrolase (TIGR01484 family)
MEQILNKSNSKNKISLIVSDIDGCILPKGKKTINLKLVEDLRRYNKTSKINQGMPPLTICSGRPGPFVELVMKLIGGYVPAIFEWGGGLYIPETKEFVCHRLFNDEIKKCRHKLISIISKEMVKKLNCKIQFGKEIAITIYPGPNMSCSQLLKKLQTIMREAENSENYNIMRLKTHVNLIPKGVDKGVGVLWLAEYLKLNVEEFVAIGDDKTDLSLFKRVGYSACPSNANPLVREFVDYISPHQNTEAVIDILRNIIKKKN